MADECQQGAVGKVANCGRMERMMGGERKNSGKLCVGVHIETYFLTEASLKYITY